MKDKNHAQKVFLERIMEVIINRFCEDFEEEIEYIDYDSTTGYVEITLEKESEKEAKQ